MSRQSQFGADRVTLDLSRDEWADLVFQLGYAGGHHFRVGDERAAMSCLRLANAINEGNPDWTPYEVDA